MLVVTMNLSMRARQTLSAMHRNAVQLLPQATDVSPVDALPTIAKATSKPVSLYPAP